ncbi:MAG: hypothetical protein LUE87_10965 [Lachnospiraceae bacterium]|nr:hypothetical protein [Lachnospiraceae bacterium]
MAKEADKNPGVHHGTPYDDVFRTLTNDCSPLLIPLINEVFGERFTGNEEIVFSPNIHYLNRQDGGEEKRVTDSSFSIIGAETKKYLLECQSTSDNSMLVRIFEYSTQIALDEGRIIGNTLEVEIPNCAVLYLRSTKNTPDNLHIRIRFQGKAFTYEIPAIKMQKYSLDELLQKNLLFLLPFYIFTYDSRLKEYNTNEKKLNALKAEFRVIVKHLDHLEYLGQLSAYFKKTLIEMSEKVVNNLAANYGAIKEGVKAVMGGQILEYEAKTILRQGQMETLVQNVQALMETMNWTAEQALDKLKVPKEKREAVYAKL